MGDCNTRKERALIRRMRLLIAAILLPAVLVLCAPALAEEVEYSSIQDLADKRIGVQTGSTFDAITRESLPNAEISYYNTYADLAEALITNKVDGFPGDEPVVLLVASEHDGIGVVPEHMDDFEYGIVLPKTAKGAELKKQMDEWIKGIRDSGELEKLCTKWISGPADQKTIPDYHVLPAPNGTLTMATEGGYPPMNYYHNNEMVGLEIDLAAQFCEAYGYGLKLQVLNFDGILPSVQAGKADFAMSGFTITKERAESVLFSEPYYKGGTVMAVRKSGQGAAGGSFNDSITESFSKTFLREDRWKLFFEGVVTTLLITILSIILGTTLGFVVFVLCRSGGTIPNAISGFFMWLLQGMPMVVLLMILYYIVFGSFSISGIVISIVGFTLTFGTSVFGMLKMGVNAVDDGQREAAFAMGYSDRQTFFKIILPQALPHVMDSYKSAIIDLIKATSIVGYIAVQDLTKMGDIVRSRTYEAFFPLIAVAVIYFVLEGLVGLWAELVNRTTNPKRRSSEKILKGVKTDD